MRRAGTLHSILEEIVREDTAIVTNVDDFGDELLGELGVSLHGNVLPGEVHALNGADVVGGKRNSALGVLVNDVAMHLLDTL